MQAFPYKFKKNQKQNNNKKTPPKHSLMWTESSCWGGGWLHDSSSRRCLQQPWVRFLLLQETPYREAARYDLKGKATRVFSGFSTSNCKNRSQRQLGVSMDNSSLRSLCALAWAGTSHTAKVQQMAVSQVCSCWSLNWYWLFHFCDLEHRPRGQTLHCLN